MSKPIFQDDAEGVSQSLEWKWNRISFDMSACELKHFFSRSVDERTIAELIQMSQSEVLCIAAATRSQGRKGLCSAPSRIVAVALFRPRSKYLYYDLLISWRRFLAEENWFAHSIDAPLLLPSSL
jgi:hypothetical protein